MFCRFCGKEAQDGQSFCPYCGKKDEAPIKNEESVFVPPVRTQPVQSIPAYEPQMNQPAPAEKKKKSKLPLILVALILVVAIVAGVIFVPGLLKDKEEKEMVTVWVISGFTWGWTDSGAIKYEFEYNEDGLLSNATRHIYSSTVTKNEITYIYDENHNMIEMHRDDNVIGKHTYDERGNKIYSVYFDANGEMEAENYYTYDESNRLTSWKQAKNKMVYEYDEKGNLVCEIKLYNGEESERTTNKYDAKNNRTESEDEFGKSVYKYDKNNRLSEIIRYTADGTEEGRCIFKYDEHGNPVSIIKIENDGSLEGKTVSDLSIEYISVEVNADMVETIEKSVSLSEMFGDPYNYNMW